MRRRRMRVMHFFLGGGQGYDEFVDRMDVR